MYTVRSLFISSYSKIISVYVKNAPMTCAEGGRYDRMAGFCAENVNRIHFGAGNRHLVCRCIKSICFR